MSKDIVTNARELLDWTTQNAPDGYTTPKAAEQLITHAEQHGWKSGTKWASSICGSPFLQIQVGRKDPMWHAQLTWHSFDLPHGRLRLSGRIWKKEVIRETTETGHNRTVETGWYWRDLPSLKALHEVIEKNPVKREEC